MDMQRERCSWLDFAKGVAIVLVVLGHSLQQEMRAEYGFIDVLHQFIYSFHMQLFVFLSGVAHAIRIEQNKSVTFRYRIRKLLVPWGYYSLFVYILVRSADVLLENYKEIIPFEKVKFGTYFLRCLAGNNPYVVHTWFLLALFLIVVLFDVISKFPENTARWLQGTVGICFLVLRIILISYTSVWLNQLKRVLQYYIFFVAGCYFPHTEELKKRNWETYIWGGSIVIIVACALLENKMAAFVVKQVGAILIIQGVVEGAQRICKEDGGKIWCKLGRSSYPIYLLHHPWCSAVLGKILYCVLNWNVIVAISICTISSIAFPLLCISGIRHCEILKWALGPLGLVRAKEKHERN